MKICVYTLGCKVNQYEGQAIIDELRRRGIDAVSEPGRADAYIFNTCSVTAEADKKSRQLLAKAAKWNPAAPVYILGCSSQNRPQPYAAKPNVRYIRGTTGKLEAIDHILADIDNHAPSPVVDIAPLPTVYEPIAAVGHTRSRAYIKVQDGCNNFCSYCIVPYLRGRSRSRALSDVMREAQTAVNTTGEIVLTGINLSAYGKDIETNLSELILSLRDIPTRKRLGSLECTVIDERLLAAMKEAGFCGHFHLSLQSGSDSVLRRMNRHYTTAEFLQKVNLIRRFYPDAGITTDIICGFPQETEQEHAETLDFVQAVRFSDIHVFPYSERAGTKAATMPQVEKSIRSRRAAELTVRKKQLHADFLTRMQGKILPVYFEETADGWTQGYTENYIRVYAADAVPGAVQNVIIKSLFKEGVQGEIV